MTKTTISGKLPCNPLESSVPNSAKRHDGQYVDHWVMSEEELTKGFVRPVRLSYVHEKCGSITSMPKTIAETYAANPSYYGQTFCCHCRGYFPVGVHGEFLWKGTDEKVGS